MGRKSLDEEIEIKLPLIITMVKDGCKDKEIIEMLGISASTWKVKKAKNKKLRQALEEITDERNQEVEESLFKCCKGYSYYEEVAIKVKEEVIGDNGSVLVKEDVKVSKVKKYKGPDIAAQKYWLNNRKKSAWKEDPSKDKMNNEIVKIRKKEVELKEW